ncbi:Piso0_001995 [Millerozyma farinosa CBS 7064]|uniref:Piso0_001995 protein n=1 Tax=Pichia sorbitophila (strain ATCC MYA-4447 / BCRC 22081 / CBS 7064 / NBRC 10061 / NRRL Y-12695) TaxID=559304 RepID=G8YM91_PICSO|nr:Piso0_001995 [Millerozyma farinosa CBS 7064]
MGYTKEKIEQIDKLVDKWLEIDINALSRKEITDLKSKGDYECLDKKLSTNIKFGTAGLRSEMTSGFAYMNDVTILTASQGLVQYILENNKSASIVIGYDHRHHSQRFAEITASVALSRGVKVYYLGNTDNLSDESISLSETKPPASTEERKKYVHTPLVPFSVNHFGASAGVMVTASHNPAKDNGFKVYYGNGCQIIPPQDKHIATYIENNQSPWHEHKVWDIVGNFEKNKNKLLVDVTNEVTEKYLKELDEKLITQRKVSYDFVFTALHGVGLEIFSKVFSLFDTDNKKLESVHEQDTPDPDFPTVSFPNPEEKGALDLAIKRAEKLNYKLVLACDPDADRFSVSIKTKAGTWHQLTGNEIGFLFAMYVIEERVKPEELKYTYLINSTVSSQILASMADKLGFHFVDTLTGFKWIGNKAIDLKKEGYNVPFAYEEAIGFMFDLVDDKDGISAAAIWMQLYEQWFSSPDAPDPLEKLKEGYLKYGWHKECNGYYRLTDLSVADKIFKDVIQSSYKERPFPARIGSFTVKSWRDLEVGYDSTTADHVPVLPGDPTSHMVTATMTPDSSFSPHDVVRFTCRGSGTEPKIKLYIEGKSDTGPNRAYELARQCWDDLKANWFRPDVNDLEEVIST